MRDLNQNYISDYQKNVLTRLREWIIAQDLPNLLTPLENQPERFAYDLLSFRDVKENLELMISYRVVKGQWSHIIARELERTISEDTSTPYDLIEDLYCSSYAKSCIDKSQDPLFRFPRRRKIADIGCGLLVTSKPLLVSLMRHKNSSITFIDNNRDYNNTLQIVDKIIDFLELQDQTEILDTSADEIPVNDELFELIWVKYALHEFASVLSTKEWALLLNKETLTPTELEEIKTDLLPFLNEIYRISSQKGQLILEDHILDLYNLKYVKILLFPYYKTVQGQNLLPDGFQINAQIKRRLR
ncbi:MAG: hypothetical protein ACFFCQ_18515 [Promethearchaeota archaeon]